MSTLSLLHRHAQFIRNHPRLVRWYLRNRVREASLCYEYKHPEGKSFFPRGITLKPTLGCNLRCKMCGFAFNGDVLMTPKDCLPLETWVSFVDQISAFRPYICITGGEPLLYPHFAQLLKHVKSKALTCTVTTNGTLLSKRAAEIMENPPDALVVSIDGPADIHESVRGVPGCFDRTMAGIAAINEIRKSSPGKSPLLIINSSITSFNYSHAEKMIDIAHDAGVDTLNYQFQWSFTTRMVEAHNKLFGDVHGVSCSEAGMIETPPVDPDEVVKVVRRIRALAGQNGSMYVTFHPHLKDSEVRTWYADPHNWVQRKTPACAWMNTDILPNGDVEACAGLICGNITRESFSDIWNGPAFQEHRKRLAKARDFPICVRCCAYFRRD